MRGSWGFAIAALLFATNARAVDYVDDPLTAATFTGRGSNGGTFGASGWTTVNEPDALWYEIAEAIPTGKIEYTVTGLSLTTLSGVDHDILTFYQAPTGKAEPVPYSPYFRNNDFKAFTRIFGTMEPGRGGAMKLELAFCPRGEPWHHDFPCTPECDKSGIAYARGTDKDVGWDGAKSYRMVMAWEPGKISFSRDAETLGTLSFAGTYAAKPLRVRFGSPRHDGVYPGQAFMPKGITFKDVKISGTPGPMTTVCGATTPDASVPDTTVSDSAVPSGEIGALQDVTVASYESGVFPDANDLNPEGSATPAVVYLKFPPISGVPSNVKLRLHTHDFPSASGGSGVVCAVDDDAWSETSLTWAARPKTGTCVGTSKTVDPDQDVEWDVTALFATASTTNRNLAIVSMDTDGVHYLSKEKDKARGPRLVVTGGAVVPPMDSGVPDASTPEDGSPIVDSSTSSDARGGSDRDNADDLEGSCGCRAAGREANGSFALLLLALTASAAARRNPSRRT